jgi:hypothetical protein
MQKQTMSHSLTLLLLVLAAFTPLRRAARAEALPLKALELPGPGDQSGSLIRNLLPGAIPEVTTDCLAMVGPGRHIEPASLDQEVVWLFLRGKATLQTRDKSFQV